MGTEVYGNSLYFMLQFAVNLTLLSRNRRLIKAKQHKEST